MPWRHRQTCKEWLVLCFPSRGKSLCQLPEAFSLGFCQHDPSNSSKWQSLTPVPITAFIFPIKLHAHIWFAFWRKCCGWEVLIVPTGITSYWSAERAAPRVAASISCLQAALGNKERHRLSLFLTAALWLCQSPSVRSEPYKPPVRWFGASLCQYRNLTKGNKWCFLNCLGF